jgi:hypothetical protein
MDSKQRSKWPVIGFFTKSLMFARKFFVKKSMRGLFGAFFALNTGKEKIS